MPIGYVSDEHYVALADVAIELDRDGETVAVTRSTARGAIAVDVPPGRYRVTLVKPGYGAKSATVEVGGPPIAFRLLSDRLLGYAWPKWVRAGETAEYRIHTVRPCRVSLWRYGLRKEPIRLLGWVDEHGPRAAMQITPDGDYTQTGVGWNRVGYGPGHHPQKVVAPERSGLYYFHAETDAGEFFSFPWVVAPASPRAPIAVLASTNTWNAYNHFGGRSNYINAAGLLPQPTVNARQELLRYRDGINREWSHPDEAYLPLSFDRPEPFNHVPKDVEVTDMIAGRQANHLAPAEWRLLAWLEREGFDYDLYAEYQLHSGALDLDRYRVLILNTHPEYWSRVMYLRVKEWVYERGGRLLYLGGNGLNCEVEFPDPDTMRCKSFAGTRLTAAGTRADGDAWESRMHRTLESEANLLGVAFTAAGAMTAAPFRVIESTHWVFAGTGLRAGDRFGERSLHERCHGGASGHETDKITPSSPANVQLLAKGLNPDDGGAEMVIYSTASGGAVFSVGSITWTACVLVDDAVSKITRNVLNRFLAGD